MNMHDVIVFACGYFGLPVTGIVIAGIRILFRGDDDDRGCDADG